MCTPHEGSTILSALAEMEGASCVFHREKNCLRKALSVDVIQDVLKKIKSTCAHFHRSDNVFLHHVCITQFVAELEIEIYPLQKGDNEGHHFPCRM